MPARRRARAQGDAVHRHHTGAARTRPTAHSPLDDSGKRSPRVLVFDASRSEAGPDHTPVDARTSSPAEAIECRRECRVHAEAIARSQGAGAKRRRACGLAVTVHYEADWIAWVRLTLVAAWAVKRLISAPTTAPSTNNPAVLPRAPYRRRASRRTGLVVRAMKVDRHRRRWRWRSSTRALRGRQAVGPQALVRVELRAARPLVYRAALDAAGARVRGLVARHVAVRRADSRVQARVNSRSAGGRLPSVRLPSTRSAGRLAPDRGPG